jgi:DNA-binding LacI/PurR family transcriptional regulator
MPSSNQPSKKATIYDVAAEAGVSKSLVSLVMRDDPSVSESRRDAVLAAIKKLNYRPSRYAQQLASHKTRSVGVLITDYKNLSFVNVLTGLREVLDDAGYQVIISDIHRSANFSEDPVDAFVSMEVEGIVFIAEPAGLRTKNLNIPTVMIGARETSIEGSDLVSSDDSEGTRLVLEHLTSLGHTHIAHLTGVGGIAANRRNSYIKQMKKRGLQVLVFGNSEPTTEIGGYLGAKELLASGEKFTAIYAANDYMAAGAISALKEQNLSVPKDVSVVGYDNAPISSNFMLKLSSVDDMGIAIGRNAATLILERANEPKKATPKVVLLKPDLVVRKSTRKI